MFNIWMTKLQLALLDQDSCISTISRRQIAYGLEVYNSKNDLLQQLTKNDRAFEMITITQLLMSLIMIAIELYQTDLVAQVTDAVCF
jgi:hypothetical protein